MNGRVNLQPAYILHTRAYRDTSLLVDFFTLDHGLLRAVARGARGPKSAKRALLQPLQPLLISLAGRGELLTLTEAEHAAPAFRLVGERLFSALYMNELLMRLIHPHEPHPLVYRLYQQSMLKLQHENSIEPVLRRFEWQLLDELGYAPDMEHDMVSGHALQPDACYLFNPESGFELIPPPAGPLPINLFNGSDLIVLANFLPGDQDDPLPAGHSRAAKQLMRLALKSHLGPKPLVSRGLFGGKAGRLPPDANKG